MMLLMNILDPIAGRSGIGDKEGKMKSITQALRVSCIAAVLVAAMAAYSWADGWNKKTVMTINNPMQIPGAVLQPGTYVFKLADSSSNRHIVQVFNKDETHLIATVLAIPNYRMKPTGDSEFGFWEAPANTPPPLRSWFYPGDNFGQEFAYPKTEAVAIAAETQAEVPTVNEEQTQVTPPEPAPAEPQVAELQAPPEPPAAPPEPATVEQPAQVEPAPAPAPAELPRTASALPFVGLIGFGSLGLAFALRMVRALS
jgi:hypothetical protein